MSDETKVCIGSGTLSPTYQGVTALTSFPTHGECGICGQTVRVDGFFSVVVHASRDITAENRALAKVARAAVSEERARAAVLTIKQLRVEVAAATARAEAAERALAESRALLEHEKEAYIQLGRHRREENMDVHKHLEDACEELSALKDAIEEHLPRYVSDNSDGEEFNHAEVVEEAGSRLRILERTTRERPVQDGEAAALRRIIAECVMAIGNGSGVSVDSSIEFLRHVPEEIRMTLASRVSPEEHARVQAGAAAMRKTLKAIASSKCTACRVEHQACDAAYDARAALDAMRAAAAALPGGTK